MCHCVGVFGHGLLRVVVCMCVFQSGRQELVSTAREVRRRKSGTVTLPKGPLESSCPPVATRFAAADSLSVLTEPGMWEMADTAAAVRAAADAVGGEAAHTHTHGEGYASTAEGEGETDTDSATSLFDTDSYASYLAVCIQFD